METDKCCKSNPFPKPHPESRLLNIYQHIPTIRVSLQVSFSCSVVKRLHSLRPLAMSPAGPRSGQVSLGALLQRKPWTSYTGRL